MAHGDYKCCAICDSKQEYIGLNDSFKDDICASCRETSGVSTVKELLKKIEEITIVEALEEWLNQIGWSECYYQNNVDDLIAYKKTGKTPEKFKSSVEWLKAIGAI